MKRRNPVVAALLSFLWPGAGHAYLGRNRAAVVFAVPLLLVTLGLATRLTGGIEGLLFYAVTPGGALTLFVIAVLSGMWRLIALADATLVARRGSGVADRTTAIVAGALVAVMLISHASVGWVAYAGYEASSKIFGSTDTGDTSVPTTAPTDASDNQIEEPSGTIEPPSPSPSAVADGRLTFLIVGIDSAPTRRESLTDTIMLVSILPSTGAVAMVSVPRDVSYFPVYNGGTYTGKINSFLNYAFSHPTRFPGGGFEALAAQVGSIVGVPVDYYAAVDLGGFRTLIDTVGGVTVVNPKPIIDPKYEWLDGTFGFTLGAGKVTLDGRDALAFARSRQGIGDSDYTRAARQQLVLLALRDKLISASMLPKLPSLLNVAGQTVRTNIPADMLGQLVALAKGLDKNAVSQVVLSTPYTVHPPTESTGGTWTLALVPDKIAALSVKLFGIDSTYSKP